MGTVPGGFETGFWNRARNPNPSPYSRMAPTLPILFADAPIPAPQLWMLIVAFFAVVAVILVFVVVVNYGKPWFQAYMSNARVTIWNLIGMSLRKVDANVVVKAKIMALQAGISTDPGNQISSRRLEAHYLAGGDLPKVRERLKRLGRRRPLVSWQQAH